MPLVLKSEPSPSCRRAAREDRSTGERACPGEAQHPAAGFGQGARAADDAAVGLRAVQVVDQGGIVVDAAAVGKRAVIAAGPLAELQRAAADRRAACVGVDAGERQYAVAAGHRQTAGAAQHAGVDGGHIVIGAERNGISGAVLELEVVRAVKAAEGEGVAADAAGKHQRPSAAAVDAALQRRGIGQRQRASHHVGGGTERIRAGQHERVAPVLLQAAAAADCARAGL